MSRLYFFNCKECNRLKAIFENQMGWMDETGKVGYRLTIENEPDGEPTGEWETVIINDALCPNCDLTYGIINGTFTSKLKEQRLEEKDTAIFVPEKELIYDDGEIPGHKVYKVSTICLKCKGELLTGSQLVESALLRKESRIIGLKPEDTKEKVMKCPTCKKADFEFDHAIRYH